MNTLGSRIRHRRTELGLSPTALAAKLEISASAISHIEADRRMPSPRLAMDLSRELGIKITLADLAERQPQPELA